MRKLLQSIEPLRALQIFQLLRFATVFLTGIGLARSGFHLKEIGLYEAFVFLSTATGFFWVNGLSNALTSRFNPAAKEESEKMVSGTFYLMLLLSTITAVLLWTFRCKIYSITGKDAEPFFPLFCAFVCLNNLSFLNETLLLLRRRSSQLLLYGILNLIFHIAGAAGVMLLGYGLGGLMIWIFFMALAKNIVLVVQLQFFKIRFPGLDVIIEQGKTALPLVLSMLISGSAETIDGFLVSHYLGNEAFALFRYGARELPVSGILAAAMSQALVARFAAEGITDQTIKSLRTESKMVMHIVFPLSILLVLFSHKLYPYIFGEQFIKSATIFNIYALLAISRMVFPQTLVMAHHKHGAIFRICLIELFSNVILSFVFLQWFGIAGIAMGTVIAFLIEKIFLYVEVRKISPRKFNEFVPVNHWLVYSFALLAAFFYSAR